jgi:hypothetical protein
VVVAGCIDTVYSQLLAIAGVSVYRRDEIPEEFHYRNNRRIAPIVLVAHLGIELCDDKSCKELKGDYELT